MSYKRIDTKNYVDLIDRYHIKPLLAKVVKSFAYSPYDEATFFFPIDKYEFDENIFSPFKDIFKKIKRENLKVFIFGDYDCDGICATTIMSMLLTKMNINHGYYLPDRQQEGYGLNLERLKQAYQKGYRVLITVDNGVSSYEALQWARENNMLIIVTDHHSILNTFTYDCFLHPELMNKDYQYLCGTAVVYLLAVYLHLSDEKMTILAMLATLSDVMPLKGINIKIIRDGLRLFNKHLYYNLEALGDLNFPVNENDLSFKIIPKINAVGRLSDQANVNILVKYLLCNDKNVIDKYAVEINKINKLRQQLTSQQYEFLLPKIKENDKFNFVYYSDLHEGLLGLLASKMTSLTSKPSFVMTDSDGLVKGSARSLKDDNLMEMLDNFKDEFDKIGGHANACGFSLPKEKLKKFNDYLNECCANLLNDNMIEYIEVDSEELTLENIQEVFAYGPYGHDRMLPYIKVKFSQINDYRQLKTDHQLKWTVNNNIQLISFENEGYQNYLNRTSLEIIGQLQQNSFLNRQYYQIMVKEIL
ncbi:MAG: DHH family phosphoesterase [Erysipelotrichia bacterium]|nr:DHH family phosphoesterase [Erysipelotrichia bacterium]